jgi:hypothetical protein
MNTKDFLRLVRLRFTSARQGVPLPPLLRYGATRATDFVAQFIPGGASSLLDRGVKHVTL